MVHHVLCIQLGGYSQPERLARRCGKALGPLAGCAMPWGARLLMALAVTTLLAGSGCRLVDGRPLNRQRHAFKKLKNARINAIKHEILSRLGFTEVPNLSGVNTTTEDMRRMVRLYRRSVQQLEGRYSALYENSDYLAKQFYSFVQTDMNPEWFSLFSRRSPSSLYLNFPVNIPQPKNPRSEQQVYSAKLKLYVSSLPAKGRNLSEFDFLEQRIRVNLYQILEVPRNGDQTMRKRLVDSQLVSLERTGWVTFDVKQAFQQWVDLQQPNLGLEVSCDHYDIHEYLEFVTRTQVQQLAGATNTTSSESVGLQDDLLPVTDVHTREREIVGRMRRSSQEGDCVKGDGESRCCRFPLWVDFAEIGWDMFIVEPRGYQAYFCDGSCPLEYRSAHHFASIKSYLNHIDPATAAAPAPCCTAKRLAPQSLLLYNKDQELVVQEYDNMSVDRCWCA